MLFDPIDVHFEESISWTVRTKIRSRNRSVGRFDKSFSHKPTSKLNSIVNISLFYELKQNIVSGYEKE